MTVLVTGGAGYIGSHAVYQLIQQGHKVVVVDNLKTGHREAVHKDAVFYEGDIRKENFLDKVFEKEEIDSVIHFAASSLVGESMEEPFNYFENNVFGTQALLKVMNKYNVKYIVFSSTAAIYGEPDVVPIKEDINPNPKSPYGETKLIMEKLMKWMDVVYGIKFVSLRYFNVAGASKGTEIGEDHQPETHLIPLVLQTALGKRPFITVYGDDYDTKDGSCIRDFIHVEDLINAHLLALNYLKDDGESEVFNLGSNSGFSVKEIISTAEDVTGRYIITKIGERRVGDPGVLIADSSKAKKILGWNPVHSTIEVMIEDAWKWLKKYPNGYKGGSRL